MIFSSVNEEGIPKWKMILEERTVNGYLVDVTRRFKPKKIGGSFAVQPNRGIKQVCRIEILSCLTHYQWCGLMNKSLSSKPLETYQSRLENELKIEAHREGFRTFRGLLDYLNSKKINIYDTHRINYRKENNKKESEVDG